jgi:Uma2 family endonuclease
MVMLPPDAEMLVPQMRRLKRVEYERLYTEGFFDDERVELLFGMVVEMAPVDVAHDQAIASMDRALQRAIGDRAWVRCQCSYPASDDSEPQPDFLIAPAGTYWTAKPDRAHLVIEVARSSLRRDRGPKRRLYASARIEEYWIVNHEDRCVEVYREPDSGEWRSVTIHRPGETIAMLAFPDVKIAVSDVLPPP